jgi:hypothetical protein
MLNAATSVGDFAEATHLNDWLRHPVYGDPSFDSFQRLPGNPIYRGTAPFEWPVNGFFFPDPRSGNWYVFIGDYAKGYLSPPSRCVLCRSTNRGRTWTNLGTILEGNPKMFDKGGHTPDASVVYAEGLYHMVYDWGEPDFNAEGGLAYAWAEQPEGPWHRAAEPITRNSTLPHLLGRYQRTYAATLLRRTNDWVILGMMDHAPHSWALFAMTAHAAGGPYTERRLVRCVEDEGFHPPLLEFFPAFVHEGLAYAPATSVALNRNFQALFRAPLERADDPAAWTLFQYGSVWHTDDVEGEHFGIWGQAYSGFVDHDGVLRVMFPSRDHEGQGTINMAHRPWKEPMRKRGFSLSGHSGPSLTLLRRAYTEFTLEAEMQLRGTASLLFDYAAPLGPNRPASDATLHPLAETRHVALQFAPRRWSLLRRDTTGHTQELASGPLREGLRRSIRLGRNGDLTTINLDGREVWSGQIPAGEDVPPTAVLGIRVEKDSHLAMERFRIRGESSPACMVFLHTEALLGAGASAKEWGECSDAGFRFGVGAASKVAKARAKWNVIGSGLRLWSPCGPGYGSIEVRLDGRAAARIDLHSEEAVPSMPVWSATGLADTYHTVVLVAEAGPAPLDCLEVTTER